MPHTDEQDEEFTHLLSKVFEEHSEVIQACSSFFLFLCTHYSVGGYGLRSARLDCRASGGSNRRLCLKKGLK